MERRPLPEGLVGEGEPAVMLVLEFVRRRPRRRIALIPEFLNESIPVLVRPELLEDLPLQSRGDIRDVLKPGLVFLGRDGSLAAARKRGQKRG
jgi:hypothetical protein